MSIGESSGVGGSVSVFYLACRDETAMYILEMVFFQKAVIATFSSQINSEFWQSFAEVPQIINRAIFIS